MLGSWDRPCILRSAIIHQSRKYWYKVDSDLELDRRPALVGHQQVEHCQRVLPTGQADHNAVTFSNHLIVLDCLTYQSAELLFDFLASNLKEFPDRRQFPLQQIKQ